MSPDGSLICTLNLISSYQYIYSLCLIEFKLLLLTVQKVQFYRQTPKMASNWKNTLGVGNISALLFKSTFMCYKAIRFENQLLWQMNAHVSSS